MAISLRQCRGFESLDSASADRLGAACRTVIHAEARTDLSREPQSRDLVLFLNGWGCRYVLFPDGRRHIPALVLPGDMANIDVLDAGSPDYGVATLTQATVALLSGPAVRALMEEDIVIARAIARQTLQESRDTCRRSILLACFGARERFANLLCELICRLSPDEGGRFSLPLTQSDFADAVGLSTVHVNRVLQGLRAEGLIQFAGKRLNVLDWNGLTELGHFRRFGQLAADGGPSSFGPAPSQVAA